MTSDQVIVGLGSQLSVASAMPVTPGPVEISQDTVGSGGHDMEGGASSTNEMVWIQLELLPQASVDIHVRVITLSCGQEPPAVASDQVIVGLGSQLSVASAMPVTPGPV